MRLNCAVITRRPNNDSIRMHARHDRMSLVVRRGQDEPVDVRSASAALNGSTWLLQESHEREKLRVARPSSRSRAVLGSSAQRNKLAPPLAFRFTGRGSFPPLMCAVFMTKVNLPACSSVRAICVYATSRCVHQRGRVRQNNRKNTLKIQLRSATKPAARCARNRPLTGGHQSY